jgi:hypothetical protein
MKTVMGLFPNTLWVFLQVTHVNVAGAKLALIDWFASQGPRLNRDL